LVHLQYLKIMANPITNAENIERLTECVEALANAVGDQFQRINTVSSGNPRFEIDHLITDVKTDLVAAINSLYMPKNPQLIIESSQIITEEMNCFDLIFRSATNLIIEIPNFTTERFSAGLFNEGPGQVSFVNSPGINVNYADGTILLPKKVGTIFKILNENNQVLKGEFV